MPPNYGRNALRFAAEEEVEELPSFLENIESVYKRVGGSTDAHKKTLALRYCSQKTKEQWQALTTMDDAFTWEEFVQELKSNYPELKESEKGSLKGLAKFVEKIAAKAIKIGDLVALQSYNMEFRSRVKKLLV
ncbi:hypothetical protein C8R46DRAFT_874905, partial [Mycena filopes]